MMYCFSFSGNISDVYSMPLKNHSFSQGLCDLNRGVLATALFPDKIPSKRCTENPLNTKK